LRRDGQWLKHGAHCCHAKLKLKLDTPVKTVDKLVREVGDVVRWVDADQQVCDLLVVVDAKVVNFY
jgi:hypothetical protein